LIGVGAFLRDGGGDGYNDLAECGGEWNQGSKSRHALKSEALSSDSVRGMTTMERFLFEPGAWSSYLRRDR
jgi:hypothetical protein